MRLVKYVSIPSLKSYILELEVDPKGSMLASLLLFEPKVDLLEPLGISTQESLVTVQKNECMLVPIRDDT